MDARLRIDPGIVLKLEGARIEAGFGARFWPKERRSFNRLHEPARRPLGGADILTRTTIWALPWLSPVSGAA
jgi:hypothetical protein